MKMWFYKKELDPTFIIRKCYDRNGKPKCKLAIPWKMVERIQEMKDQRKFLPETYWNARYNTDIWFYFRCENKDILLLTSNNGKGGGWLRFKGNYSQEWASELYYTEQELNEKIEFFKQCANRLKEVIKDHNNEVRKKKKEWWGKKYISF